MDVPERLVPGGLFGRYELISGLGRGGMAEVWLARRSHVYGFEKIVALKLILLEHADDEELRTMFLDEVRLASRIRHPNVAEIIDLGEEDGVLFSVMEWVDGDTLSALLRARKARKLGPMPRMVASRIVADVCAGLHAAHELCDDSGEPMQLVHRDVSPQNIIISSSGCVKLVDFGVAKAMRRLAGDTSHGVLKGKIAYMSPEQVAAGQVDRRTDVFAAGLVLYEALVGSRVYQADDSAQLLARVAAANIPPPDRIDAGIPPGLVRIVCKALAPDPSDRYQTAQEMALALEKLIVASGAPVTPAHVAPILHEALGDRIEARHRLVRQGRGSLADMSDVASSPGEGAPTRLERSSGSGRAKAKAEGGISSGATSSGVRPPTSSELESTSGIATGDSISAHRRIVSPLTLRWSLLGAGVACAIAVAIWRVSITPDRGTSTSLPMPASSATPRDSAASAPAPSAASLGPGTELGDAGPVGAEPSAVAAGAAKPSGPPRASPRATAVKREGSLPLEPRRGKNPY